MTNRFVHTAAVLLAALALSQGAAAQTTVRAVVGAGGTVAATGSIVLVGTIGQTVIGPAGSAALTAGQGFWYTLSVTTPPLSVDDEASGSSERAALACVPNPIAATGDLHIRISTSGRVTLRLYDGVGRTIATLIDEVREAGTMVLPLDATHLAAGSYRAELSASGTHTVLPILVVK